MLILLSKEHALCSVYSLLLVITLSMCAVEPGDESSAVKPEFNPHSKLYDEFDPFGLRAKAAAKYKESLQPKLIFSDEAFQEILVRYRTDLPSKKEAQDRIDAFIEQHPVFDLVMQQFANPKLFKRAKYPSRLLFVGPSGCGKTTTAKALAKHCDMTCVFIKGSAVGNTYQNSGATFIAELFQAMLERPEQKFMVIIDEFMAVAQFTEDAKELQQNKTAMALWQALDACENKRHICVIGTDNGDPDELVDQLKTRFAHDIFVFQHAQQDGVVRMMKECLGYHADSGDIKACQPCSDAFLQQLAQSVTYLSLREIEDLIEKAKVLAIAEVRSPTAAVTEKHLKRVFAAYQEPHWLKKIWLDRHKHLYNMVSPRALSLYMTLGGFGIQTYGNQYETYGTMLAACGLLLNNYWPKDEKEANDMPFLSAISHLFAQSKNSRQWKAFYGLN